MSRMNRVVLAVFKLSLSVASSEACSRIRAMVIAHDLDIPDPFGQTHVPLRKE